MQGKEKLNLISSANVESVNVDFTTHYKPEAPERVQNKDQEYLRAGHGGACL